MKGCLGGCGKREERERERGECLNMDEKKSRESYCTSGEKVCTDENK